MGKLFLPLSFLLLFFATSLAAAAFSDISGSSHEVAIGYLYEEGIVQGYEDGTYQPDALINRAEFVKVLMEAKYPVESEGAACFSDVGVEWYAPYVCHAKSLGVVSGYEDGAFRPANSINLAEALKVVLETYDVEVCESCSSLWYEPYYERADELGLLEDIAGDVSHAVTRGEMAELIYSVVFSAGSSESAFENPFEGATLYVDPSSNAYDQIEEWGSDAPEDSADLLQIAGQPTARWFGDWYDDIESSVDDYVSTVTDAGGLPVMVAYNIPDRDCGSYSAGGSSDADNYKIWIQNFANGVGDRKAVVILEPDALALDCLYEDSVDLLSEAVTILKSKPEIAVYIDAGHFNWVDSTEMATRLTNANVENADGFALNVSNFYTTAENVEYGEEISTLIGDKHFVIDTSRNGNGSNGEWCNPSGMRLGQNPTTDTGYELVDALFWVKPPGQSDGTCNGGPSAGTWWVEYALDLVRN